MKRDLKIRIWKWIAFVGFSLSLLLGVGVNAQTASELMNRMAEVYKSSGCIDISASVTVKSVVPENNGKSEFTMLLKGKKFKMDTPDMTVWFDGETQWAYLKNSEEVNVSLPNSRELISTNPLALMQSYDTFFEVKGKSETVAFNGKGCYKLQLSPKKAGRGVRQYRKEDVETAKLIYHLVKERGMTLPGARQRMKDNKENTLRNYEIVERLKNIREELLAMRDALDAFTYDDLDALKENIGGIQASER